MKDIYGEDHPLIGVACLFDGKPAIPYGSYTRKDEEIAHGDDGVRLVVAYFDPERSFEGTDVSVKAISDIKPDSPRITALPSRDSRCREIYHRIMTWLVENRCGTFQCREGRESA